MNALRSGELAKQAQVNPETLRYYEREGLLPEPERTTAGYRVYTAEDVQRVQFIKRAQELGFSLKEIKELLALRLDETRSASVVKSLTEQKIETIQQKIDSLEAMKTALLELSATCSGKGSAHHCPILKSLDEKP
jgi:Hg(II)-responsive transcriptional regulator